MNTPLNPEQSLRLECLRIAGQSAPKGATPTDVVRLAEALAVYVREGVKRRPRRQDRRQQTDPAPQVFA